VNSSRSVNPMAAELEPHRARAPKDFRFPRKAAKRCYELAARFVLAHEAAELVHGIVTSGGVMHSHAWAELNDVVYDGTCRGFYNQRGYYLVTDARPVRRFGSKECAELVLQADVYGPCPELMQAEREALRDATAARRAHGVTAAPRVAPETPSDSHSAGAASHS
jgi:hypothetical protein